MGIIRHVQLYGRVQGVFFRESMCRKAAQLGISGWVRNLRDGTLEAMMQGDAAQVETLIAWARRGPPAAHVEKMKVSEGSGEYSGFERLPNS